MFTDPNRKEKNNASKTVVDPEQLQAPAVPEPVVVQDPIQAPETVDDPEASAVVAPIAETGPLPSQDSEPPVGAKARGSFIEARRLRYTSIGMMKSSDSYFSLFFFFFDLDVFIRAPTHTHLFLVSIF